MVRTYGVGAEVVLRVAANRHERRLVRAVTPLTADEPASVSEPADAGGSAEGPSGCLEFPFDLVVLMA